MLPVLGNPCYFFVVDGLVRHREGAIAVVWQLFDIVNCQAPLLAGWALGALPTPLNVRPQSVQI
jgi:hypothetical protein